MNIHQVHHAAWRKGDERGQAAGMEWEPSSQSSLWVDRPSIRRSGRGYPWPDWPGRSRKLTLKV